MDSAVLDLTVSDDFSAFQEASETLETGLESPTAMDSEITPPLPKRKKL